MKKNGAAANGLGTFAGVFTPSILTILGIILFLRLGYVVGNAGLWRALLIIGLANAISVLTSVSLSAIATNMKVKGGGDYYLISRTLGLEFGGAIGLVLFLAQSVSIGFYCVGFGEAVGAMLPGSFLLSPRIIAMAAMAVLFILAWMGADVATRFQFVVMALLVFALVSFFTGGLPAMQEGLLAENWATPDNAQGFWVLFAVFFPAVTGFTQGVSMSGDLRDPGKSLPLGTFAAVFLSIAVYFGVALVFAAVLPLTTLGADYTAMKAVARWPVLIDAGVIAATLSSAMASFLGAPRILQSLAHDRIFPFLMPFAAGHGPSNNPRRGLLLAAAIGLATVALGNLNLIASVVSMFFLISYGLLNYATYFEARAASPSFRPRFGLFDKRLSLLGFLACLGAMLAIDPAAASVAIAVLFAIYQYLQRTAHTERWADSQRSHHLQEIRKHLLATANEPEHFRDWRPQILAFSDSPLRRARLLEFSARLEGGSGTTTVVRLVQGRGPLLNRQREEARKELKQFLAENHSSAFPLAISTHDAPAALETLFQSFGIGPVKANTVLLNWFEERPHGRIGIKEIQYAKNLRTAYRLGMNIVLLSATDEKWEALKQVKGPRRRMDVWFSGDASSRLMLLLAYLITRSNGWEDARIRVITGAEPGREEASAKALAEMLDEVRIPAEPFVCDTPCAKTMRELSADAALVFCPFRLRYNHVLDAFGSDLEALLKKLPPTALVLAGRDVDLAAEPDEGEAAEAAAAMDDLEGALKAEQSLKQEADEAAKEADAARQRLDGAPEDAADRAALETSAAEAKDRAEKALRKAGKAAARVKEAIRVARALGVLPEGPPEAADPPEETPESPAKGQDPSRPGKSPVNRGGQVLD